MMAADSPDPLAGLGQGDWRSRLESVIGFVMAHFGVTLPRPFRPGDNDLRAAAASMMRIMLVHASAVVKLAEFMPEAAAANVRTLLESWVDLRYVLLVDDPRENARRHLMFALLDLLHHCRQTGQHEVARRTIADLRRARQVAPAAYEALRARRAPRGRIHRPKTWAGIGRTGMMRRVQPTSLGDVVALYRTLSWEAHGVVQAVRDVARVDGCVVQRSFLTPDESADYYSLIATRLLVDGWQLFAREFERPRLPLNGGEPLAGVIP